MNLRPVIVVRVKNVRARNSDSLTDIRYRNIVRIVLTGRHGVSLSDRANTDNLDHQITVLV